MRPPGFVIVLAVVCLTVAGACGTPAPPAAEPPTLRLRTGTVGGAFRSLGEALARRLVEVKAPIRVQPELSAGSVSNVLALHERLVDIALAQADVVYLAYEGRLPEVSHRVDGVRGLAVLYLNPLHFIVRGDSGITSMAELKGRRVGFGSPGGGTGLLPTLLLGALGIPPGAVDTRLMPFDEASRAVAAGRLDAMFVGAGYPNPAVLFALDAGATLLPIAGAQAERVIQTQPFFRSTFIPGGTYEGYREPVATIGVDTLLVCRSDLDAEAAYEITRALFQVLPSLAAELPALRSIDLAQVAATPVPLHAGAARYYREREIGR